MKFQIPRQKFDDKQDYFWSIFQISVVILPLFPALGELGLVVVLIGIWRNRFFELINCPINRGLFVFTLWLIISSYFAYQSKEAWLGLANFLPFFALFAAVAQLINKQINTTEKLERLAWLLAIPSFPIVILGIGQLYFNWSSPQLLANILGWSLVPLGVPTGRMSSVFIYANFLAIYLSFTFIFSLGLWLSNWYGEIKKKSNLIILSIILVTDSIGLILANSRNSWLIVFLACFSFAIYLSWYWLVTIITACITVIFGASFGDFWGQQWLRKIIPELIWGRLSDKMYPDRPVETLRFSQWQFCWSKIQEKPFLGWGLRNFTPLYLEATNFWFGHPHNLFIMLSLEIGVVATVFFCLIIGYILATNIFTVFYSNQVTFNRQNKIIIFTYLITFISCILFNIFDVTLFELRVNTISWIVLSAIASIPNHSKIAT